MSQSTIKMEKGYYNINGAINWFNPDTVAIHNKNGKGLLLKLAEMSVEGVAKEGVANVAIHNKNGKGLLHNRRLLYAQRSNGRNPQ